MEKKYFCGNEISEYGLEHGRVDYRCLAKAFDAVLANGIIEATDGKCGYWEPESGSNAYYEDSEGNRYYSWSDMDDKREELFEKIDKINDEYNLAEPDFDGLYDEWTEMQQEEYDKWENDGYDAKEDKIAEIQSEIDILEEEHYDEVFQWYIVESNALDILEQANEIVYYNEELDLYLWGVTHYGTSWDYVLTDIKINW